MLTPADAAAVTLEALDRGLGVAILLIVGGRDPVDGVDVPESAETAGTEPPQELPADPMVGRRMVVTSAGCHGDLDDDALTRAGRELGEKSLMDPETAEVGVHTLQREDGSPIRVYLEVHQPRPELWIVGAGHIGQPLSQLGAILGFHVSVLDDRPEFVTGERFPHADRLVVVDFSDPFADIVMRPWTHVVLVTRGHRFDYECLRRVLLMEPAPRYVGMIGSRRRVRATFGHLLEEEIPRDRIAAVHAPIGLDIGAETPAEIALCVAAELVLRARGGTGASLRDEARVLERFFPEDGDE